VGEGERTFATRGGATARLPGGGEGRGGTWWIALIGPKLQVDATKSKEEFASAEREPAARRTLSPAPPRRASRQGSSCQSAPHHGRLGEVLARAAAVCASHRLASLVSRSGGGDSSSLAEACRC